MTDVTPGQRLVCAKAGVTPDVPEPIEVIGLGPLNGFPIHGLRHARAGQSSGWFIWAGREVDRSDEEFFKAAHIAHLPDQLPEVLPFLALPPGWRFLLAPGYEDVWFDETLLNVE